MTQINLYRGRGSRELSLFLQLYNVHPWIRDTGEICTHVIHAEYFRGMLKGANVNCQNLEGGGEQPHIKVRKKTIQGGGGSLSSGGKSTHPLPS